MTTSPVGASPATVERAFQLWTAALVVFVISSIVNVLLPPSTQDWVDYARSLGQPPAFGQQMAAASSGGAAITSLVFTIIFVALFAWFGLKMRSGANWARIVNVVIAALGILGVVGSTAASSFVSVPRAGGAFGVVLQLISAVLLIGFIWFAFQRPSNEYFSARH